MSCNRIDIRRFKSLGRVGDLPDGKLAVRKIGSREFLLLRRGPQILIGANKCPHHGARLSGGLAFGTEVICPCHLARFDLRRGRVLSPPSLDGIPTYCTRRRGGEILVGPVREEEEVFPPAAGGRGVRRQETIVIVGAGAAGNAAAETLRREGFAGRVVMLTREPDLPYDRTALSKGFLTGAIPAEQLPLRSPEFYEAMGIEILTGAGVRSIEVRERRVVLQGGGRIGYSRLLLASGGAPRRLAVPGIDLAGVHYLRSRADASRLAGALDTAGRVVVVGAGFIGLEVASALVERGISVHLVAPEPLPLAPVLGKDLGRWILDRHRRRGVRFFTGCTVRELRGAGRAEEVVLADGRRIGADLVIVGVGIEPAAEYLRDTNLLQGGALPVNARMRTAIPEIYAAGDLAAAPDPAGVLLRSEHWVEAERQGQRAARSMLGRKPAPRSVPFFWSEQQGLTLKCVGRPDPALSPVMRGSPREESFLVGFFDGPVLRAAAGVNRDRELIAAAELIRGSDDVPPERFGRPETDLEELAGELAGAG